MGVQGRKAAKLITVIAGPYPLSEGSLNHIYRLGAVMNLSHPCLDGRVSWERGSFTLPELRASSGEKGTQKGLPSGPRGLRNARASLPFCLVYPPNPLAKMRFLCGATAPR